MSIPNPGSDEAFAQGCICPVIDNGHGWGCGFPNTFVINGDCPLHKDMLSEILKGNDTNETK